MKTLPENPSLHHLRKQAKDLLAGLRDSNPSASLADAQSSLAEQYGFRSWTDLKAEVDRQQGQAEVADPALAREIASRFRLGDVTGPMRSVSQPDEIGRLWVVQTSHGDWALRTVDDVFPVTDGEENARFQEAAARAGITLPAPVRSRTGAVVEVIEGHQWRVYQWLHSAPPLAAPVSAATTGAVGEILAVVHALRFPVAGICPWSSMRLSTLSWPEFADLAAAQGARWASLLAAAVPTLAGLEALGAGALTSEPLLCHNNLNPGNVRLGPHGRLVVTGWEHANGLPAEWELSAALASWSVNPNGGINAAGARALLEGYRQRAGSLPMLTLGTFRGAAIGLQNYVAGQVDRALDAAGTDDERYADRNVRHLLTHLPSAETYERVLDAALAGAD